MQKIIFYFLFFLIPYFLIAQKTFYAHFGTSGCLNEVWDAVELKNQTVLLVLNKIECQEDSSNNASEIIAIDLNGNKTLVKKFSYTSGELENIGGIHPLKDSGFIVTSKLINSNNAICQFNFYYFDKKFKLIEKKEYQVPNITNILVFKSHYEASISTIYFSFNDESFAGYIGSIKQNFSDFKTLKLDNFSVIFEVNLNHDNSKYIAIRNDVYTVDTSLQTFTQKFIATNDVDILKLKWFSDKR